MRLLRVLGYSAALPIAATAINMAKPAPVSAQASGLISPNGNLVTIDSSGQRPTFTYSTKDGTECVGFLNPPLMLDVRQGVVPRYLGLNGKLGPLATRVPNWDVIGSCKGIINNSTAFTENLVSAFKNAGEVGSQTRVLPGSQTFQNYKNGNTTFRFNVINRLVNP